MNKFLSAVSNILGVAKKGPKRSLKVLFAFELLIALVIVVMTLVVLGMFI
ncbi:hypothetical protein LVD15_18655 [Fulvivirga maritima]|nr:hypothetical protein [Fulvivirga maritima]UII25311.1 hypothetical protein LVD15_18655 [Fulvivirga maritima]